MTCLIPNAPTIVNLEEMLLAAVDFHNAHPDLYGFNAYQVFDDHSNIVKDIIINGHVDHIARMFRFDASTGALLYDSDHDPFMNAIGLSYFCSTMDGETFAIDTEHRSIRMMYNNPTWTLSPTAVAASASSSRVDVRKFLKIALDRDSAKLVETFVHPGGMQTVREIRTTFLMNDPPTAHEDDLKNENDEIWKHVDREYDQDTDALVAGEVFTDPASLCLHRNCLYLTMREMYHKAFTFDLVAREGALVRDVVFREAWGCVQDNEEGDTHYLASCEPWGLDALVSVSPGDGLYEIIQLNGSQDNKTEYKDLCCDEVFNVGQKEFEPTLIVRPDTHRPAYLVTRRSGRFCYLIDPRTSEVTKFARMHCHDFPSFVYCPRTNRLFYMPVFIAKPRRVSFAGDNDPFDEDDDGDNSIDDNDDDDDDDVQLPQKKQKTNE